jgi:ABC-type antimicrobial peptide transport system permease subunit
MAIRMALGARRWHIYRLTLGHGLPPIAAGLAAGIALAVLLTQFLAGLLHGVTPTDTATFIAITALLAVAALAASAIPARRAARIDVLSTLREE